ncbi:MAG: hypothetical protein EAZ99_15750 [Alphaproteobacteria bacterium]|nr:MAG: hypothetical protein EAZ99_15750 [Alphaproteobacteria bacterium]
MNTRAVVVGAVLLAMGSAAAVAQSREPIQIMPLRPSEQSPREMPPPPVRAAPPVRSEHTWIVPPGTPTVDPILRPGVLQGPRGLQPDGRFVITREMCRDQVAATPAPDVAYRAGVDSLGRPVAPADLPSNRAAAGFADRVVTDILIDPVTRAGRFPTRGEGSVGRVEVDTRTGEVILNGRPSTGMTEYGIDEATLARLCRDIR